MPSVKKTSNIALCDYVLTEKQTMEDYNGDNFKIDTAVKDLRDKDTLLQTNISTAKNNLTEEINSVKNLLTMKIDQHKYVCHGIGDGAGLVSKLKGLLPGTNAGVRIEISAEFGFDGTIDMTSIALSGKKVILDFSKCYPVDISDIVGVTLFPNISTGNVTIIGLRIIGTIKGTSSIIGSGYLCRDCEVDVVTAGDMTVFSSNCDHCTAKVTKNGAANIICFSGEKFVSCNAECAATSVIGFTGTGTRLLCIDCNARIGGASGNNNCGIKFIGSFLIVIGCTISVISGPGMTGKYAIDASSEYSRLFGNRIMGSYIFKEVNLRVGGWYDEDIMKRLAALESKVTV